MAAIIKAQFSSQTAENDPDQNAILRVFDEKANDTNRVASADEVHSKGYWHESVGVVAVNSTGYMLIEKLAKWGLAAYGHRLPGEAALEAAERLLGKGVLGSAGEIDPSRLYMIGRENGYIRMGSPDINGDRYDNKVFQYQSDDFNSEFSTLFLYLISDSEAEKTKRLTKEHRIKFLEIGDGVAWVNLHKEDFDPSFRQYFLKQNYESRIVTAVNRYAPESDKIHQSHVEVVHDNFVNRVAIVSPECGTYFSTGGLGLAVNSIAQELANMDVDTTVFMIKPTKLSSEGLEDIGQTIAMPLLTETVQVKLLITNSGKVRMVLLDAGQHSDDIYGGDALKKAIILSKGSLLASKVLAEAGLMPAPQIFHGNDWMTGLIPAYLRIEFAQDPFYRRMASLYTIHNLAYQGGDYNRFPGWRFDELGLAGEHWFGLCHPYDMEAFNIVTGAFYHADKINTVSPTYSKEILTVRYGEGQQEVLGRRIEDLSGILNGISISERLWRLSRRKRRSKNISQRLMDFNVSDSIPLFGMNTRITTQKGILAGLEGIEKALNITQGGLQLGFFGSGNSNDPYCIACLEKLEELKTLWPRNLDYYISFGGEIADQLSGGQDYFFIPSDFEPCGLGQQISLEARGPVVARRTGGLADTVFEYSPETGEGNGFLYDENDPDQITGAIMKAIKYFHDPQARADMVRNTSLHNRSWANAAVQYLELYKQAIVLKHNREGYINSNNLLIEIFIVMGVIAVIVFLSNRYSIRRKGNNQPAFENSTLNALLSSIKESAAGDNSSSDIENQIIQEFPELQSLPKNKLEHVFKVIYYFMHFINGNFEDLWSSLSGKVRGGLHFADKRRYFRQLASLRRKYNKLSREQKNILITAIIIHDIGYTIAGVVAYHHPAKGAEIARELLSQRKFLSDSYISSVADIIHYHCHFDVLKARTPKVLRAMGSVLRTQVLICTAVDNAGSVSIRSKEATPENGLIPNVLEQLLVFGSSLRLWYLHKLRGYWMPRLGTFAYPLDGQTRSHNAKLSKAIRDFVPWKERGVFKRNWNDNIAVCILPLLRRISDKSSYKSFIKFTKLIAQISEIFLQENNLKGYKEFELDANTDVWRMDREKLVSASIAITTALDAISSDMTMADVREDLRSSGWTKAGGIRFEISDNRLILSLSEDKANDVVTQRALSIAPIEFSGIWQQGVSSSFIYKLFADLAQGIEALAKMGLSTEIIPETLERALVEQIRTIPIKYGLKLTAHAPFYNINVTTLDDDMRLESIKVVEESIRIAADMGIDYITVHPGPMRRVDRESPKLAWAQAVASFIELVSYGRKHRVQVSVENMHQPKNKERYRLLLVPQDMARFLQTVPGLKMTFDTAHHSGKNAAVDYLRQLVELIDVPGLLGEVHLSDASSKILAERHLPFGEGDVDFVTIFKLLIRHGFAGHMVMENYSNLGGHRVEVEELMDGVNMLNGWIRQAEKEDNSGINSIFASVALVVMIIFGWFLMRLILRKYWSSLYRKTIKNENIVSYHSTSLGCGLILDDDYIEEDISKRVMSEYSALPSIHSLTFYIISKIFFISSREIVTRSINLLGSPYDYVKFSAILMLKLMSKHAKKAIPVLETLLSEEKFADIYFTIETNPMSEDGYYYFSVSPLRVALKTTIESITQRMSSNNTSDHAYNGYTQSEVENQMQQYQDRGTETHAAAELDMQVIGKAINEALAFLQSEGNPNATRGPPAVQIIESDTITFGATYDHQSHTVTIERTLLTDDSYSLVQVFIHELNAGTHQENNKSEEKYLLAKLREQNQANINFSLTIQPTVKDGQKSIFSRRRQQNMAKAFVQKDGDFVLIDDNLLPVATDVWTVFIGAPLPNAIMKSLISLQQAVLYAIARLNPKTYKTEPDKFHISVSILQNIGEADIFDDADLTLDDAERNDLIELYKKLLSDVGTITLRLAGMSFDREGGVVALFEDDGRIMRIRQEFYRRALKITPKISNKKPRIFLLVTLLRIMEDIDEAALEELKILVAKIQKSLDQQVSFNCTYMRVARETRWMHHSYDRSENLPLGVGQESQSNQLFFALVFVLLGLALLAQLLSSTPTTL
ncbi:MAG: glycogen/starch synthase, partial [Candidatus Omnitrophica bacterium]|nr:glycogen/starch synthase [Candidatus Omnitrophota bacterium]